MLPSLYVAASMPSYVETQIVDEDVEPVDFQTDASLIGISFMTFNAPRAYEIADQFRAMGKCVIFGGYHPTFMQEEAKQHADAVCIGEAELNVPRMVEDYMSGSLKPFYQSDLVDLKDLPEIDRNLLHHKAYISINALQATRGCNHHCDFCSVAPFHRFKIRTRPVEQVMDELKGLSRTVLFMDDNITLNKAYARELFTAMMPLKKLWFSQCEIGIAEDEELLDLARRSGCSGLFIGFESLSQLSLSSWNKHCNRKKDYLELVRRIHRAGIGIFAAFVFGSDEEGPEVFPETLDFLHEANIEVLQSTRLTPFPGTRLYEKLSSDDRILDRDWSHYDFFHVVHQPQKMSRDELHYGIAWLQKQFYSYRSITQRMRKAFTYLPSHIVMKAMLPLNFGYRRKLSVYGAFEMSKSFHLQ
jgi:radical SAM superfamily enzyme YgiQ (UPF0313 family)